MWFLFVSDQVAFICSFAFETLKEKKRKAIICIAYAFDFDWNSEVEEIDCCINCLLHC